MDLLQIREKEIFETLKKIKDLKFVIIGGYAVNAYTLPRFSVDCDVVVEGREVLGRIEKSLLKMNFNRPSKKFHVNYAGDFESYKKKLYNNFVVSIDIMIGVVLDRQTNATFTADWIFENSKIRALRGKTIPEKIELRVINADALFVMKMVSCRAPDIRDVFMLLPHIKDKVWIRQEVSKRYDFENRFTKIKEKITSKQFKDGLQGVYGYVEDKIFEKHKKLFLELK